MGHNNRNYMCRIQNLSSFKQNYENTFERQTMFSRMITRSLNYQFALQTTGESGRDTRSSSLLNHCFHFGVISAVLSNLKKPITDLKYSADETTQPTTSSCWSIWPTRQKVLHIRCRCLVVDFKSMRYPQRSNTRATDWCHLFNYERNL